jgi:transposase InsO family protein
VKAGRLYIYISGRRDRWTVKEMCKMLNVSESGYYKSLKPKSRSARREQLLVKIKEIISQYPDNDNYGARRVHIALQQQGEKVSYPTVYRTMKDNGLLHKKKRHPNGITKEDREAQKAENIIKRDFTADRPNTKWLTDITEIPCIDGKLYLSAVLDCFDSKIIGIAMADNMRKELAVGAFKDACAKTGARGMICHSDRGSQYTSGAFRDALAAKGATQSMSGTGKCYDNAKMESFFATLKKEKLYKFDTSKWRMADVKTVIFRYIFVYYNRQRIHTTNPGGWPPEVKRRSYYERRSPSAAAA